MHCRLTGHVEWRISQPLYQSLCLTGSTSWFTKVRFHRARTLYARLLGIIWKPLTEHFSAKLAFWLKHSPAEMRWIDSQNTFRFRLPLWKSSSLIPFTTQLLTSGTRISGVAVGVSSLDHAENTFRKLQELASA